MSSHAADTDLLVMTLTRYVVSDYKIHLVEPRFCSKFLNHGSFIIHLPNCKKASPPLFVIGADAGGCHICCGLKITGLSVLCEA